MSIAEFATRINRTRPTVYDIFNRKSIDTDLLIRISEVLHYDFLREVYLKETPRISKASRSKPSPRYIVGMEVSEEELKSYPNERYSLIVKVIGKENKE